MSVPENEIIATIQLARSENIGPQTYQRLMQRFGDAETAVKALPGVIKHANTKRPIVLYEKSKAEKEIEQTYAFGAQIVTQTHPLFPSILTHIAACPITLTILGNSKLLEKDTIGIVGARNASYNACEFTKTLAQEIGNQSYGVASGLAKGIDTAAHNGALATGTIAVIAGGIDSIYPKENTALYREIAEKGCIITEYGFGTSPIAQQFPRRNRIISGLSRAIIVVEAAIDSGSLITARYALEQNREIFAVPGFPLDPRCSGTNKLIKEGAYLLESIEDIDAIFSFNVDQLSQEKIKNNYKKSDSYTSINNKNHLQNTILELLHNTPVEVDFVEQSLNCNRGMLHQCLLELELEGKLQRHSGNRISRIYTRKA